LICHKLQDYNFFTWHCRLTTHSPLHACRTIGLTQALHQGGKRDGAKFVLKIWENGNGIFNSWLQWSIRGNSLTIFFPENCLHSLQKYKYIRGEHLLKISITGQCVFGICQSNWRIQWSLTSNRHLFRGLALINVPVLPKKFLTNFYQIPDSAGCLYFTGSGTSLYIWHSNSRCFATFLNIYIS
jgi:hypothetical protein